MGATQLASLSESPFRLHLLERMLEGSADIDRLEDEFDVHRRTILRNLAALEDAGWITNEQGTYSVTPPARLFTGVLSKTLDRLEVGGDIVAFYEHVSSDEFDVPPSALSNVEVVTSTPLTPHKPLECLRSIVVASDSVQIVLPVVSELYIDAFTEALNAGAAVEIVLAASTADSLGGARREPLVTALDDPNGSLYASSEEVPCGILISGTRVLLGGYDGGVLRTIVEGNGPPLRTWAERTYDEIRCDARPFRLTDAE